MTLLCHAAKERWQLRGGTQKVSSQQLLLFPFNTLGIRNAALCFTKRRGPKGCVKYGVTAREQQISTACLFPWHLQPEWFKNLPKRAGWGHGKQSGSEALKHFTLLLQPNTKFLQNWGWFSAISMDRSCAGLRNDYYEPIVILILEYTYFCILSIILEFFHFCSLYFAM